MAGEGGGSGEFDGGEDFIAPAGEEGETDFGGGELGLGVFEEAESEGALSDGGWGGEGVDGGDCGGVAEDGFEGGGLEEEGEFFGGGLEAEVEAEGGAGEAGDLVLESAEFELVGFRP